jgi:putative flippase GtrA
VKGWHRPLRYVAAGAANTLATYLAYLLLLRWMPYAVAYSVVYVAGIALSYFLNARWVFRTAGSWRSFLLYPSVYGVQYLVGLAALYLVVDGLGLPRELAPLIATAATLPLGFLMTRRILQPTSAARTDA